MSNIGEEKFYYSAHAITKNKFEQELRKKYNTPSKTSISDRMGSVSTRSQIGPLNSHQNGTSSTSSLTDSAQYINKQSPLTMRMK